MQVLFYDVYGKHCAKNQVSLALQKFTQLIIAFFSPEIFHALNIQKPPEGLVGVLQIPFFCLLPMLDPTYLYLS